MAKARRKAGFLLRNSTPVIASESEAIQMEVQKKAQRIECLSPATINWVASLSLAMTS
jgi:hypothetical protein